VVPSGLKLHINYTQKINKAWPHISLGKLYDTTTNKSLTSLILLAKKWKHFIALT